MSKNKRSEVISTKSKKVRKSTALTVNFTGIRDGEIIIGNNPKQSKGVEMQIKCAAEYWPIDIASDELVRDQFKSVEFFSKMTFDERKEWISSSVKSYKAPSKENHLHDSNAKEEIKVKFVKIEADYFSKLLGAEVVEMLMKGNEEDEEGYWPLVDVYELFRPKDKATVPNRFSLVFRPDNWEIKRMVPKRAVFNGPVVLRISSSSLEVSHNARALNIAVLEKETLYSFSSAGSRQEIGIIYDTVPVVKNEVTQESLLALASKYLSEEEQAECDQIIALIQKFTPSLFKSLMQKIVRTRCSLVIHDGHEYSARAFLLVALILLSLHPGNFNPNKQRYVTGLESSTKRLAVIICEDSYVKDMSAVSLLLVDALIKKQDRAWVPPLGHFATFFQLALEALDSSQRFSYNTEKEHLVPGVSWLDDKQKSAFKLNFFLIKEIGSMHGDINFFSDLVLNRRVLDSTPSDCDSKEVIKMQLVHCIDQHSFTSIAHFMPYDKTEKENSAAPFKALFSRIWKDVGSVNGRKDRDRMLLRMEDEPFVQKVRFAQRCIFEQKYVKNTPVVFERSGAYKFEHKIDESWLAGLIGVLRVKLPNKGPKAIVVLRTQNIQEMAVIRNPGSAGGLVDLTIEEKEEAIELAKDLLRAGYPLKHVPGALSSVFKGAKVWLVDNEDEEKEDCLRYEIEYANGERVDWIEEATKITNYFEEMPGLVNYSSWEKGALMMRGMNCVASDCDALFDEVLDSVSLLVLKRLYMYLANYRPTIKLYDIARDGSASKLDVSLADSTVFQILCSIAALYSVCLELGPTCFNVKNGPVLWRLRDVINQKIVEKEEAADMQVEDKEAKYWPSNLGDAEKPLFCHQQDTVDEMIAKVEKGKRGHGLYLGCGLGKTQIIMSFIQRLITQRRMPTFCVYSAPPSAIANTLSEFERFGVPYHVVVGKDGKDSDFVPYAVNVILQDQARRVAVYAQLKKYASQTLFILDEFHYASTSTTIRSSIALEISKLAKDFVFMSGTVVKNTNCADLLMWLEQSVEFYVDIHNYLVAFGSLISKKYETGVVVNFLPIMAPFKPKEELAYYATVTPKLGGTGNAFNFPASLAVCYEAADREIVRQILHYVEEKGEIVFVLAKTKEHQEKLKSLLVERSANIKKKEVFLVDKEHTIILKPETKTRVRVVITTILHITGMTLTKCKTCISGVYPTNQSTRDQFVGRLDRIGQKSPSISVITIHCGILSYLLANYKKAQSFAESLKEFASVVDDDFSLSHL